jgi:TP901 family phage tail tape measure protein
MGDFKLKIDIAKPDVNAAERGLKSIFSALDKIDRKSKSVDSRLSKLGSGVKAGGNSKAKVSGMSKFGSGLLGGLGVGGGAAAVFTSLRMLSSAISAAGNAAKRAAVEFGEFQNNIVSISRISGIAESEISAMSTAFLELSSSIPVSAIELQRFAETASRFGIKSADGVQAFAETFGKLQSIIGTVTEDTTKSVARITNLTNFPIEEVDKFANAVVFLGKNFATTEDQIIRTAARVAGGLNPFGVTADEALGLAAALDSLNVNAELGGSALIRIFNALQDVSLKSGNDLSRLAEISGMTSERFSELALTAPIKAFKALVVSGAESFEIMDRLNLSGVRVQDVLGKLVGRSEDFTKAMNGSNDAIQDSLQFNADAARQADTLGSRYTRLGNAISAAFISVGGESSDASESLKDLTDTLLKMAEAFTDVDSTSAAAFPGMAALGESVREMFKEGVRGLNELATDMDKLMPLIGGAFEVLTDTVLLATKAMTGFANSVQDSVSGIADLIGISNNMEIDFLGRIITDEAGTTTGLNVAGKRAGDKAVKLGGQAKDPFELELDSMNTLASKTLPGIISQLDKYKEKAADITFENSIKGMTEGEKRLERLRRGFKKRFDDIAPKVKRARELIEKNKDDPNEGDSGKFVDHKELDRMRALIERSEQMKENFEDVKSALTFKIALEELENLDNELQKIDSRQIALNKAMGDVTAGPAPDVNAITDIESTAAFIADSKRADKEAEFQREQLKIQQEILNIDRQILAAAKKRSQDKLEVANFRNRP